MTLYERLDVCVYACTSCWYVETYTHIWIVVYELHGSDTVCMYVIHANTHAHRRIRTHTHNLPQTMLTSRPRDSKCEARSGMCFFMSALNTLLSTYTCMYVCMYICMWVCSRCILMAYMLMLHITACLHAYAAYTSFLVYEKNACMCVNACIHPTMLRKSLAPRKWLFCGRWWCMLLHVKADEREMSIHKCACTAWVPVLQAWAVQNDSGVVSLRRVKSSRRRPPRARPLSLCVCVCACVYVCVRVNIYVCYLYVYWIYII
jgi:hypothetical protein